MAQWCFVRGRCENNHPYRVTCEEFIFRGCTHSELSPWRVFPSQMCFLQVVSFEAASDFCDTAFFRRCRCTPFFEAASFDVASSEALGPTFFEVASYAAVSSRMLTWRLRPLLLSSRLLFPSIPLRSRLHTSTSTRLRPSSCFF